MREKIVAVAGRRIDAPNAETPRFPLSSVGSVQDRLKHVLKDRVAVVCSAACGADLLALEQASLLHIRCKVILPFAREEFRTTSVTDRPGDWGPLFDRLLDSVEKVGDLIVLPGKPDDNQAYAKANAGILEQSGIMAGREPGDVLAVIVWDGKSRGADDLTAAFRDGAHKNGYSILEVPTV